jgi:hypothetical protein
MANFGWTPHLAHIAMNPNDKEKLIAFSIVQQKA